MGRPFICPVGIASYCSPFPLRTSNVCFLLSGCFPSFARKSTLLNSWCADFFDVCVIPRCSTEQLFHAIFAPCSVHLRDALSHASSYHRNVALGSGFEKKIHSDAQGRARIGFIFRKQNYSVYFLFIGDDTVKYW